MRPALQRVRWHRLPSAQALQEAAARRILDAAARAIRDRGRFHVVLAGGQTPRAVYRRLRTASTDWSAWHVYFGDERCLPPGDPGRNSQMAARTWLDQVAIPASNIRVIPAERGARAAARVYAARLRRVDAFDLVLLGLGEDGHTASLFPGHEWAAGRGAPDALAVLDAPKPPRERVTLSAARLSRAREALFLVEGTSKRDAVARWRAGENIPARAIRPRSGVDVLVESRLLRAIGRIPPR